MKKGRSEYNFQINCDTNKIDKIVKEYISAAGFVIEQKGDETYYKSGDSMNGYKYFNYKISDNVLTIYAWLKGVFGEIAIDQDGIGNINVVVMDYRESLSKLFKEIEKNNIEGGDNMDNQGKIVGYDTNTGEPIYENKENTEKKIIGYDTNTGAPIYENEQNSTSQFAQSFQDETIKKQEKVCEIGFWLSLVGLLLSFFGVSYGLLVYIMDFYFASQGLKTRKRGKAIATIVLSIISLVIVILGVIISNI